MTTTVEQVLINSRMALAAAYLAGDETVTQLALIDQLTAEKEVLIHRIDQIEKELSGVDA
jgi:hypothetical protein